MSAEHHVPVLLGGAVDERVVIDETFATRDLVADVNRTAVDRVLTVTDSVARSFAGDRQQLIEERSDDWPLVREEGTSDTVWSYTVSAAKRQHGEHPLATVTAGDERSARSVLDSSVLDECGHVAAVLRD